MLCWTCCLLAVSVTKGLPSQGVSLMFSLFALLSQQKCVAMRVAGDHTWLLCYIAVCIYIVPANLILSFKSLMWSSLALNAHSLISGEVKKSSKLINDGLASCSSLNIRRVGIFLHIFDIVIHSFKFPWCTCLRLVSLLAALEKPGNFFMTHLSQADCFKWRKQPSLPSILGKWHTS